MDKTETTEVPEYQYLIEFIQKRKRMIRMSQLARVAGMPESTLRAVVRENNPRPLPEMYIEPLTEALTEINGGELCQK